jgi:hypothetical protein
MTMIEGDALVTIEFQLQTRRKFISDDNEYTPFRTVYTGSTEDDVMLERKAHIDSGYLSERLRVLRVTTIEEVWKL